MSKDDIPPEQNRQIVDAAKRYHATAWYLVVLTQGSKKPLGTDGLMTAVQRAALGKNAGETYSWTDDQIDSDPQIDAVFGDGANVAVAFGDRSDGLVDIDLDCEEAGEAAQLVATGLSRFGRKSREITHLVLRSPDAGPSQRYSLTPAERALLPVTARVKLVIAELRSSGSYTMLPPSVHPGGERLYWHGSSWDDLRQMPWREVLKLGGLIAFLALVLSCYPTTPGSRNDIALALSGFLLRLGVSVDEVDHVVVGIARLRGDEEAEARRCARATKDKLDAGEPVTGLKRLLELLGIAPLLQKVQKWLPIDDDNVDELTAFVMQMNEKYFVIGNEGGQCLVGYFEDVEHEGGQIRQALRLQSFDAFRKRFQSQKVQAGTTPQGKPIYKEAGAAWLDHSKRRQYDRIEFLPGRETGPEILNMYRGFAVEARRGSWRNLRRHVWRVLAKRDREAFRYILKWAAWAVQNPGQPAEVALVFRGGKGTGKGTFCRWLKILFGQHGLQIYSAGHLTGRFNSHLRDTILLFADEAIAPNDKDAENILKGLITERALAIEGKGKDLIQARNTLHVVMASNSDYVVHASSDERRFAVFDASGEVANNHAWFNAIDVEMRAGGAEAMLYDLLNLRLGNWHPRRKIPANDALLRQQIESLTAADRVWFGYLASGDADGHARGADCIRITTKGFAQGARISDTAAGNYLRLMGCRNDRSSRPTGWLTPPLAQARAIWEKTRFKVKWDAVDEWNTQMPSTDDPPKFPF